VTNKTPLQGILSSKELKSYDAKFFNSIKLAKQMRDLKVNQE